METGPPNESFDAQAPSSPADASSNLLSLYEHQQRAHLQYA